MDAAIWVAIIGGLFSVLALFFRNFNEEQRINIAIFAEIQRLLHVLDEHAAWWARLVTAGDTKYPLIEFLTPVFDQHEKNLGRISADAVGKVVQFYGYVKFINALQAQRAAYIAEQKSGEFDAQYLRVLERIRNDFKDTFAHTFHHYALA
jgi:hypothetical protein